MSIEIGFDEMKDKAVDNVERSWRRVFSVARVPSMVNQGLKHKRFDPDTVTVEFAQRNTLRPRVTKVVVRGLFPETGRGLRSFNREELTFAAPDWLVERVDAVVAEVTGWRGGVEQNAGEIETHRRELAVHRNDPFVNSEYVQCAYDRCGEVLTKQGDEHPWVTALHLGWKLAWGLADPTGTDLWCKLDHDDMGNPIYKD